MYKTTLTKSRHLAQGLLISKNEVLIIGGKRGNNWLSSCIVYKPFKEDIVPFPSLNSPRSNFSTAILNSNIIVVYGGFSGINKLPNALIEIFDLTKQEDKNAAWKEIQIKQEENLYNYPILGSCLVPLKDSKFLILGGTSETKVISEVFEYDLDSISAPNFVIRLANQRTNMKHFCQGNKLFILGGSWKTESINDKNEVKDYIEEYILEDTIKVKTENNLYDINLKLSFPSSLMANEDLINLKIDIGLTYYGHFISI